MKTLVLFFVLAFLLTANTLFAQAKKTTFESASVAKETGGATCINLTWKKGTENTAYYLVERSADGKAFKQIAIVFTAEDASFCSYKFRDKRFPASGAVVYYRITLVNDQKEVAYLPVKEVEVPGTRNAGAFSNASK